MSPERWQAVVSPDPARDQGLQAEWDTHVIPWYAYAICWAVVAGVALYEWLMRGRRRGCGGKNG